MAGLVEFGGGDYYWRIDEVEAGGMVQAGYVWKFTVPDYFNIISCNGDAAVQRSVEAAIRRSSPLPEPSNPDLFDRNLTLNLTLEREN